MGFSKVGFARAESLSEPQAHLREWLARGYHGEMKWMERDPAQRADPRKLFPQGALSGSRFAELLHAAPAFSW